MKRRLEKVQPYVWIAVGIAIGNLAWVLMGRLAPSPEPVRRREPNKYVALGTGQPGVRILQFYTGTPAVIEGGSATLCYGVENAVAVRLEPPVEELKPSFNRCFEVTPKETTTYTLTAEGKDGATASASFTVQVRPAPARIVFVNVSSLEVKRGQPVMVCAKTEKAVAGRIEPVNLKLAPGLSCVTFLPARTMNYRVTFQGAGGSDSEKFRIVVK